MAALMLLAMGLGLANGLEAIPIRMKEFVDEGRIAGSVTLVMQKGKVIRLDAIGYRDLESRTPMTSDTIFQVMSMTKPVTAVAIMMLADEGKLSLNDPVERFLPGYSELKMEDGKSPQRRLRISHLLTHTSGLPGTDPRPLDDDMKRKLTLADLVDRIPTLALQSEPGTRVSYSGPGITVAGRIVEIVSKQPLQSFLQDRLFGPLGMADTTFFADPKKASRMASVYTRESTESYRLQSAGVALPSPPPPGVQRFRLVKSSENILRPGAKLANPAGGLYSTAEDMAKFHQLVLNEGVWNGRRLLSRAACQTMTQVQSPLPPPGSSDSTTYGYGWAVTAGPSNTATLMSPGVFGHSGAFGTYGWGDPRRKVVGILMTQLVGGDSIVTDAFRTLVNASIDP